MSHDHDQPPPPKTVREATGAALNPIDATIGGAKFFGMTKPVPFSAPVSSYNGKRLFYTASINGSTLVVEVNAEGPASVDRAQGGTADTITLKVLPIQKGGKESDLISARIDYNGGQLALGASITEDGTHVNLEFGYLTHNPNLAPVGYIITDVGAAEGALRWVDNPVYLSPDAYPPTSRVRPPGRGSVSGPLGSEIP